MVDTAMLCGLDIKQSSIGNVEVQAKCPFCGDYKYRMYLCRRADNAAFWCHNCAATGNAVSLYAAFNPYGRVMTTYEAYRALLSEPSVRRNTVINDMPAAARIRSLDERSNIYLDFLSVLKLDDRHYKNLQNRGLTDGMIKGNMYRSIPTDWHERQAATDYLCKKHDLSGIPGFYTKSGKWLAACCKSSGILIPVCTVDNKIQGLQIRLDSPPSKTAYNAKGEKTVKKGERFRWFSTGGQYYENGTGISSYIHVVGDVNSDTLHITEGPMKADVASFLSGGELFIGLTGVQNIKYLADTVKMLKPKRILECIDMDVRSNPHVQRAQARIRSICMPLCSDYKAFTWPVEQKGIDDWLLFEKLRAEYRQSLAA